MMALQTGPLAGVLRLSPRLLRASCNGLRGPSDSPAEQRIRLAESCKGLHPLATGLSAVGSTSGTGCSRMGDSGGSDRRQTDVPGKFQLTPAQRRALEAVRDGKVILTRHPAKCAGGWRWSYTSARRDVVERLIGDHLVDHGPWLDTTHCPVVLTDAGREALG